MAIAFDNSYSGSIAASESVSRSFTIGSGSDRYLIAFIYGSAQTSAACNMSSVQYDGVAMTLLGTLETSYGGNPDYNKIRVYYLLESSLPSGGAHNFTCTAPSGLYIGGVHLIALSGVSQGAPEATQTDYDNTSALSSFSTSITTLTDNAWVVDALTCWNGQSATLAANAGQTARSSPLAMYAAYGAGASTELQTPAGSETQGWSWTVSSQMVLHYLLSLAPAGAVGGENAPFFGCNL